MMCGCSVTAAFAVVSAGVFPPFLKGSLGPFGEKHPHHLQKGYLIEEKPPPVSVDHSLNQWNSQVSRRRMLCGTCH